MKRPRRKTPIFYALCGNALLLLAILIVLAGKRNDFSSMAFAGPGPQQPIAGGAGIFLMPGQFSSNTWGCYVMDVDMQTLCAYQFFPGEKQLRLVAARNFRFDRQLKQFNNGPPTPAEVEKLVDLQNAAPRGVTSKPVEAHEDEKDSTGVGTGERETP